MVSGRRGGPKPDKIPLLVLRGGPGAGHDYLESMADLAETGREVIFYDQLGSAHSATPSQPEMWTIELYLEEIDVVRQALGLEQVHLLGQSWGGMLAMEYALRHPVCLISLIVSNSPASMTQWVDEANKLRADLPVDVQQTLRRHEADGTTDSLE